MEVKEIRKFGETPCYESEWVIIIEGANKADELTYLETRPYSDGHMSIIKDEERDETKICIRRFCGETQEKMGQLVEKAVTPLDIVKLHRKIYYD